MAMPKTYENRYTYTIWRSVRAPRNTSDAGENLSFRHTVDDFVSVVSDPQLREQIRRILLQDRVVDGTRLRIFGTN